MDNLDFFLPPSKIPHAHSNILTSPNTHWAIWYCVFFSLTTGIRFGIKFKSMQTNFGFVHSLLANKSPRCTNVSYCRCQGKKNAQFCWKLCPHWLRRHMYIIWYSTYCALLMQCTSLREYNMKTAVLHAMPEYVLETFPKPLTTFDQNIIITHHMYYIYRYMYMNEPKVIALTDQQIVYWRGNLLNSTIICCVLLAPEFSIQNSWVDGASVDATHPTTVYE